MLKAGVRGFILAMSRDSNTTEHSNSSRFVTP
jgi:hypothetical protein